MNPADEGGWTPVDRKTARSHRERSGSASSNHTNNSATSKEDNKSVSTVAHATAEMSPEELMVLARRYQAMADQTNAKLRELSQGRVENSPEATAPIVPVNVPAAPHSPDVQEIAESPRANVMAFGSVNNGFYVKPVVPTTPAVPAGEGPSKPTGKGVDPRNWGNVSFLGDFTEKDFDTQREALNNYAEINRVIKQVDLSVPPGFFNHVPVVKIPTPEAERPATHFVASNGPSVNERANMSGQTKDEEIAELKRQLTEKKRKEQRREPAEEPMKNRTKQAAHENIAGLMRGGKSAARSGQEETRATAGRIAAGSALDKAIQGAERVGSSPPDPDPSDDSSDPGSDHERGPNSGDEMRSPRQIRHFVTSLIFKKLRHFDRIQGRFVTSADFLRKFVR
jgi:hypothetical protein